MKKNEKCDDRQFPLLHKDIPLLTRNLPQAREAYQNRDCEKLKEAHQLDSVYTALPKSYHNENHTGTSSEFLKAFVFGGLDGIITIFAIVAGCVGAHLSPIQIIIVGFGNVLADAVSMGFGEYTSARTEQDFLRTEKEREIWEVENFPEGEKQEMMEIYQNKYKFNSEDARTMVDISFKYKDFCISHMMAEELGILCDDEGPTPFQRGMVMFLAFVVFGLVPLLGYCAWCFFANGFSITKPDSVNHEYLAFLSASFFSCLTLFILGGIKASLLQGNIFKSGLQMTLNGAFAGFVAYGVGTFLRNTITSDVFSKRQ